MRFVMDKNSILNAAKKEKNRGMEYEGRIIKQGFAWGMLVAVIFSVVLVMTEYLANGTVNIGVIAVIITMTGIQSLYEGIKLKKRYLIITGSVETVIAVLYTVLYVYKVVVK